MYDKFTNEELIEAYSTMIDYSKKADESILKEIDKRGGLQKFLKEIEQKKLNKAESDRVLNELISLNKEGLSLEEIKATITSELWVQQHLSAFIESRYIRHQLFLNDKSIDKDLIYKIVISILLASIAGTGMLLLSFVLFNYVYFFLLVPIYFISYLIVKGYTGKTHNNLAVFLGGLIATIISRILGFIILSENLN